MTPRSLPNLAGADGVSDPLSAFPIFGAAQSRKRESRDKRAACLSPFVAIRTIDQGAVDPQWPADRQKNRTELPDAVWRDRRSPPTVAGPPDGSRSSFLLRDPGRRSA